VTMYHAQELCRRYSFEEVAYLRWHGELPTREQVSAQNRLERPQRVLAPQVVASLARQPATAHPIDTLRTALGALGALGPRASAGDDPAAAAHAKAVRLFAVLPSVVAADQRLRQGLGVITARGHLGYAANFLSMTFGKVPEPQIVAAFETALILYSGHIPHVPAFPSRPAASDPNRAADSAIGALQRSADAEAGPAVIEMVHEIGIPDNARPWVEEALAAGRKIPGFNYRLDKTDDARVPAMRGALGMIAGLRRGQHLIEVYEALAEAVREATGRAPLLDYPASLAFQLIGFDPQAFAPILAVARLPGWTAYSAQQLAVSSLVWPRSAADGRAADPRGAERVAPVL
jgi:citrate synthase